MYFRIDWKSSSSSSSICGGICNDYSPLTLYWAPGPSVGNEARVRTLPRPAVSGQCCSEIIYMHILSNTNSPISTINYVQTTAALLQYSINSIRSFFLCTSSNHTTNIKWVQFPLTPGQNSTVQSRPLLHLHLMMSDIFCCSLPK